MNYRFGRNVKIHLVQCFLFPLPPIPPTLANAWIFFQTSLPNRCFHFQWWRSPQKFLPFLPVDLGLREVELQSEVILSIFSVSVVMRACQHTYISNSTFIYKKTFNRGCSERGRRWWKRNLLFSFGILLLANFSQCIYITLMHTYMHFLKSSSRR